MHRRRLLTGLLSGLAAGPGAAAALAAVALSGCGRGQADIPGSPIRFGVANPPHNLDPRLATDAGSERLNRLLYRPLVDFDAGGRPVPGLADWQVLGPTRYRFRLLDQGRRFSDGSRLAAADVAATFRSILDPGTASPHRALLSVIERIEPLDADRVDYNPGQPRGCFCLQFDALFPGGYCKLRHYTFTHFGHIDRCFIQLELSRFRQ